MKGAQVHFVELDWANEEYKSSIGHQQRKARQVGKYSINGASCERNGVLGFHAAPCHSCVIVLARLPRSHFDKLISLLVNHFAVRGNTILFRLLEN